MTEVHKDFYSVLGIPPDVQDHLFGVGALGLKKRLRVGSWWFGRSRGKRKTPEVVVVALIAFLVTGLVHNVSPVIAETPSGLSRACLKVFKSLHKMGGYGALAASKGGACGYSFDWATLSEAQNRALSECRKHSKSCKVILENNVPSQRAICANEKAYAQERAAACSAVIEKRGQSKRIISQALNNRGLSLRSMGKTNEAFADYENAIKADPKYGPPYFNRGQILMERADFVSALADMRRFLKLWKAKDEWVPKAKSYVVALEARVKRTEAMPRSKPSSEPLVDLAKGYPVPIPRPKPISLLGQAHGNE